MRSRASCPATRSVEYARQRASPSCAFLPGPLCSEKKKAENAEAKAKEKEEKEKQVRTGHLCKKVTEAFTLCTMAKEKGEEAGGVGAPVQNYSR